MMAAGAAAGRAPAWGTWGTMGDGVGSFRLCCCASEAFSSDKQLA